MACVCCPDAAIICVAGGGLMTEPELYGAILGESWSARSMGTLSRLLVCAAWGGKARCHRWSLNVNQRHPGEHSQGGVQLMISIFWFSQIHFSVNLFYTSLHSTVCLYVFVVLKPKKRGNHSLCNRSWLSWVCVTQLCVWVFGALGEISISQT